MKMYILNMRTNQIIHTYKYLFGTRLVFIWQFINKSAKSMAFVFGGVQKHFESTHLSRHSTSSSLIVQNLITTQSMHHSLNPSLVTKLLLRYTSVISLVMRMYGPQYIDRVWRESPISCTSFIDIYSWMSLEWTTEIHSNHMAWRSPNLHLWFEVPIQVDGDALCLLYDEEDCTTK